jgi:hypothetical protein
MRYLPAAAKDDTLAVGQIIWRHLEALDADGLMGAMQMPLAGFGVPVDLATRLALQLSDTVRVVTAQELLALAPMDFIALLRRRDLDFIESPEILQGFSHDEGQLQFGTRPLVYLRAQLSPENWVFDDPAVAKHAGPLRALSHQLWARLEPLNQKGFALAVTQSLSRLGVDDATLSACARSVAELLTASSTFGLEWDIDAGDLALQTPQQLIWFLIDNVHLGFRTPPGQWADSALQQMRLGFAPW